MLIIAAFLLVLMIAPGISAEGGSVQGIEE
jgi:hypothetical protein